MNLEDFRARGITFVHGDIRVADDLLELTGPFDLFIEASAEPSVSAGLGGSAHYVLQTNLVGTMNCLELARQKAKRFIFLSTSRVYAIEPLQHIQLKETDMRLEASDPQPMPGIGTRGITEDFPTQSARSFAGIFWAISPWSLPGPSSARSLSVKPLSPAHGLWK